MGGKTTSLKLISLRFVFTKWHALEGEGFRKRMSKKPPRFQGGSGVSSYREIKFCPKPA